MHKRRNAAAVDSQSASASPGDLPLAPGQGTSRRSFLETMGFLTAATLAGCSRAPVEKAIPLLNQPEEVVPGKAVWYATTCAGCPSACGLLVKSRDGRPIKIEPNAESPWGGSCAVGQATVLSLYDEARLKGPLWRGDPCSWAELDEGLRRRLAAVQAAGRKVALLSGPIASPSTRQLVSRFLQDFSDARHVIYEPVSTAAIRQANRQCFGQGVVPSYRLDRARLVVGIEADFLGTWLSPVQFIRRYSARRKPELGAEMLRHVQFEAGLTLSGANADRRIAAAPSQQCLIAAALLYGVLRESGRSPAEHFPDLRLVGVDRQAIEQTARELWQHRGRSLLVSGCNQKDVQVTVNAVNWLLGNIGTTVDLDNPLLLHQGDDQEMARLVEEMNRGEVQALILYGVNPAYDYPLAQRFAEGLEKVDLSVSFADRLDETASLAQAVCPDHHFLESWNDAQPTPSFYSLAQPAMAPLFETRSAQQSLLRWMGHEISHYDYLRDYWRRQVFPLQDRHASFEELWNQSLHDGFLALPPRPAEPKDMSGDWRAAVQRILGDAAVEASPGEGQSFELQTYQKVSLRDGRHANNPWLQEMPDPLTKLTWGNYAAVGPADASRLGLKAGDVVALSRGSARIEVPVCIQPGQAASALSLALGYGRKLCGKAGQGVGANAYPMVGWWGGLRRYGLRGVRIEKTGRREALAAAQEHHSAEGRPLVLEANLDDYLRDPHASNGHQPHLESLWEERQPGRYSWGMAIDLNACVGCSACLVACQAENNVAVVGKDEVRRNRDMHWIRIDRYYSGSQENPETVFQPMMCQHCGNAPCETVCPVLATTHSSDGLNQQIYNRCIGTRYCANNCPYKVRRFNWFEYAKNDRFDYHMNNDLGAMVLNPDVVVRSRGVMEKCSMCVQRIQEGKLLALEQGRAVQDGDIRTACQQACPAEAIVFGDLLDPGSRVSRLQQDPRSYQVLAELGIRPQVAYLKKIRNRNTDA